MAQDKQLSSNVQSGGFPSAGTQETVDWGNSDGLSLWEAAEGEAGGLEGWEGRRETHDMLRDSYS